MNTPCGPVAQGGGAAGVGADVVAFDEVARRAGAVDLHAGAAVLPEMTLRARRGAADRVVRRAGDEDAVVMVGARPSPLASVPMRLP